MIYQPDKVQDPKLVCFNKIINLKISYINFGESYLIVTEAGETIKIKGEERFIEYIKKHNCEIV